MFFFYHSGSKVIHKEFLIFSHVQGTINFRIHYALMGVTAIHFLLYFINFFTGQDSISHHKPLLSLCHGDIKHYEL